MSEKVKTYILTERFTHSSFPSGFERRPVQSCRVEMTIFPLVIDMAVSCRPNWNVSRNQIRINIETGLKACEKIKTSVFKLSDTPTS